MKSPLAKIKLLLLCFSLFELQVGAQQTGISGSVDSNAVKVLFFAGLQEKMHENYGNARLHFTKILELDPENDAALFELANLFAREQKWAVATHYIKEALRLKPNNGWYLRLEGEIYKRSGNIDVQQRVDPQNQVVPLAGAAHSISESDDTSKNAAPDNYEIDLRMADVYRRLRQYPQEQEALRLAFAHPQMPLDQKISRLSDLLPRLSQTGLGALTIDLCRLSLQMHPDEPALYLLYGDVLYQQQQWVLAKEQYQAALQRSAQSYPAWEKVLALQTLTGQYTEAIKTGEEALSLYPNQAILYYYRAFALHRKGQNAEANMEIKSALQLDGNDLTLQAMIFALQAEVLIDQQKLKEADAAFDQSIALDPTNYLTMSNYAYYLALRNHNLNKAEALAKKAANMLHQNASVADTYAFVLFKLAKYATAKIWIIRALQQSEMPNGLFLEHYGDILFLCGEEQEAVVQWEKALKNGASSDKLIKKIYEKKYIK